MVRADSKQADLR